MNLHRSLALSTATVMLGGGLALGAAPAVSAAPAAPAAAQASWTNAWNATISGDYLKSHGKKWVSQGYKLPRGTNMARGVFTCWGGGNAKLKVLILDTGKSVTKQHQCNGKKHYATIAYKRGQTVKLVLNGSKNTRLEAWAGR
ncbi:hypothetical protein NX801_03450 [Streptomyces sp. LP05-1]|uniref:Secreted protein n=1 Tax=Streptomyces pyxinae TaxID=2970734 RepID=A0ABT2CBE1_9ACTN|nr:hypothetical protein [Streptomyces sp. LP05-1]MCS0634730.1 hypothetical protein [Streptomyces sp. LP05-1]